MLNMICLWTGRVVWILAGIALLVRLYFCEFWRLPLRRPWQFMKHLLPWFWETEADWQDREQVLQNPKRRYQNHWDDVELRRYGCLGIFIDNVRTNWWKPKYHLFIIKKG